MKRSSENGAAGFTIVSDTPPIHQPSFPRRRESSPVGTEIYREKKFPKFYVLDSRLRGNDG